jgi:hypothetical protein
MESGGWARWLEMSISSKGTRSDDDNDDDVWIYAWQGIHGVVIC